MNDKYLQFKKIDDTTTVLYIYGDIRKKNIIERWLNIPTDSTDAMSLKDALLSIDTPNLVVRINSYGGSVSEGLTIYSLLSEFKGNLTTTVDGFACSAASVIFMAGKLRVVPEQGLLMIHNAWSYAEGDHNAMKKMAEDLEKITQPSVNIYVSKTGLSEEKIKEMMDREQWITAREAFELGFSTSLEKADNINQAAEANCIYNLVMNNKTLEKEMKKLKEKLEEIDIEIPKQQNMKKEDALASFFN